MKNDLVFAADQFLFFILTVQIMTVGFDLRKSA